MLKYELTINVGEDDRIQYDDLSEEVEYWQYRIDEAIGRVVDDLIASKGVDELDAVDLIDIHVASWRTDV